MMKKLLLLLGICSLTLTACGLPRSTSKSSSSEKQVQSSHKSKAIKGSSQSSSSEAKVETKRFTIKKQEDGIDVEQVIAITYQGKKIQKIEYNMLYHTPEDLKSALSQVTFEEANERIKTVYQDIPEFKTLDGKKGVMRDFHLEPDYNVKGIISFDIAQIDAKELSSVPDFGEAFKDLGDTTPEELFLGLKLYGYKEVV